MNRLVPVLADAIRAEGPHVHVPDCEPVCIDAAYAAAIVAQVDPDILARLERALDACQYQYPSGEVCEERQGRYMHTGQPSDDGMCHEYVPLGEDVR